MAGEIVYADLNILRNSSPERPLHPTKHISSPQCPRWHRIVLGMGCVGNIILVGALIFLGVWVSQLDSQNQQTIAAPDVPECEKTSRRSVSEAECNTSLEAFRSCLKGSVCEPTDSSATVASRCKLCPRGWLLHGDKCYWISKEDKAWNESRNNCSARKSQMLIIQDQKEMKFMETVSGDIWIGLTFTYPKKEGTWVDGSPLDESLLPETLSHKTHTCGVIKGSKIRSEMCDLELKWICQKVAFMI